MQPTTGYPSCGRPLTEPRSPDYWHVTTADARTKLKSVHPKLRLDGTLGRAAGAFMRACGLRLPGLLALLVAVGLSVEVQAQSAVSVTMTASDGDLNGDVVEGASGAAGHKTITIALGRALTGSEMVTVPLTVVGATVTTDYAFGLQPTSQSGVSLTTSGGTYTAQNPAVVFAAGAQTATLRLTPVDKSSVDTQLAVTIDFGTVTQTGVPGGVDTPTGAPVSVIIVNDELVVPENWPLKPDGLGEHDTFRLLFVTTEGNDGRGNDIGTFNAAIHNQILADDHGGAAHASIKSANMAYFFRIVGCTAAVSARVNTVMNHGTGWTDGSVSASSGGVPIYWLNGNKLADNYFDFYDGDWDDETNPRSHTGGSVSSSGPYMTGCNDDGTIGSIGSGVGPMGDIPGYPAVFLVYAGVLNSNTANPLNGPGISKLSVANLFYGISPVYKVGEPRLEFSAATFSAPEDAGTATVTVTSTEATKTALTVNYTVTGGSAVAGTDYTTLSGSFTFPAGVSSADIDIAITDDMAPENDETITLRLDAGTGYVLGSQTTTTFTIEASDTVTAALSSDHYTFLENVGNAVIPVELNQAAPFDVQVTLTPTDGTATSADYDNSAVSATIPVGSTSVDINIPITNDSARESTVRDEEFTVALSVSARSGLLPGRSAATVVIADDDCSFGQVIRGISSSDPRLDEGDSFTYYVRPCGDPGSAQTVTITGHDGANLRVDTDPDTDGDQNTLEFDSSNWYIQQEVRIWAPQDIDARSGSYSLRVSGFGGFSVSDVTVVEDEVPVNLLVERASVNEGDKINVTVKLGSAPTDNIDTFWDFRVVTHDDNWPFAPVPCTDGTTDSADYTLQHDSSYRKIFRMSVGDTERTRAFTAVEDNTAEGPETVILCLGQPPTIRDRSTNAQFGLGYRHTAQITIYDAVTAETDGSYTVPFNWALKPSGLAAGTKFRLLFASSGRRDATSTDIGDYNDFVKSQAGSADALAAIRPYSGTFTALASTASVDARDNTSTTGAGEAIYWLNGAQLADNYADLYDGSWDNRTAKNEKGDTDEGYRLVWTGSNANGTKHANEPLGADPRGAVGNVNSSYPPILYTGAFNSDRARTEHHRLYGLSPVFTVDAAPQFEISIAPGTSPVTEGTAATFTVTSTPPPTADLTVNLTVAQTSDFGATPIGSQTVTIPTTGSAAFTVSTSDDTVDDADGSVSVTVETGTGYSVSSTNGSATVAVNDDDATPTAITLSVDDNSVSEGDSPAPTITVTATVAGSTQFGVAKTVTVSVTPRGDTTSTNYVDMTAVSNFGITIPAGATSHSQSFILTPDDDLVDESDNTVTVSGSISGDTATTIGSVPITLADDDATPTAIALSASPSTIPENGGGQTITVTAAVSGTRFGVAKTVAVSVTGHDTAGNVQFGPVPNFDMNIAAEAASGQGQFTLTPTNNNIVDSNGEATIAGTLAGATVTGTGVTITNDDTFASVSAVSVPTDWALKPADVEKGDSFRLLFVTSTEHSAQSTDIAAYNTIVQTRAKAGHGAITVDFGDQFRVLGSTATVDARDNTGTTGAGEPIYWLNGEKVADDYAGFYDGSWDSRATRNESGNAIAGGFSIWTGSNADGTKHTDPLGGEFVRTGHWTRSPLSDGRARSDRFFNNRLYALSPIFKVPNTTNVWLQATVWRSDGLDSPTMHYFRVDEVTVGEAGSDAARITVGLSRKLAAGDTVTAPLTVSGAGVTGSDYAISLGTGADPNTGRALSTGVALNTSAPYSAAQPAVVFTGHATDEVRFATLLVRAVQDTANEGAETLTLGIGAVTDNLADGTNVLDGTARVTIEDDEPIVSLAVPDSVAVEGDANRAAFVELRLAGPVPGGQTLNVAYSVDLNATVSLDGTQSGRTISATRGSTSTGTVTLTGPLAGKPTARLKVAASNNTVNGNSKGIRTADFKLTGATGIAGAAPTAAAGRGVKLFAIDSATRNSGQYKTTTMQVEGGTALGSRNVREGNTATLLLDGSAGPRQTPKGRSGGYEVLVGVQNLTTDFGDLGRAYPKTHGGAQYSYVAHHRRDQAADTDYYKVYVTGGGKPGAFEVPVLSDGSGEGGERFRVFIAETPRDMGVGGTNNDLSATASMDFTIPANTRFARARAEETPAVQAPTTAVANLKATEVDDANADVTWDAVTHARSYQVDWEAEGGSGLAIAGAGPSVTGTSVRIRHDAPERMTLTVTVTPEYVDANGNVVVLDNLAGTATLDVGPRPLGGGGTDDGGETDDGDTTAELTAPVAHWRLDGDALDQAGSNHGTVGGGAAFELNDDGSGVGSHALVLDGVDDYVDLAPHVPNFPLGDAARSVTGWFKAEAGSQRQTLFTYGPNAVGQRFSIAADRTQALVAVSGHARGVNGLDLSDGWHHVAVTYAGGDSDGISIYLDGALQAASTLVGAPQSVDTRAGPAAIGRSADGAAHYAGSIDDVRLYDAALGAEQVRALFDEHPQTPPPATTAVTATATPSLTEGSLDGADVELTLDAGAFAATVGTSAVTASGVAGVSVSSVTRDSDTRVTATLAYDGTDFDTDATLTLTVSTAVLAHSDADLSATLPVTAVDEPPPPPAVSIPAPVAHWKFDADADDSAGSSDGSAMNGASYTTAASVGSHALSLDGSDDYVDLASHVSSFPLGNSARSVTGWFRADAGNQRQTFLTYGPNAEGKRLSIAADRTQAVVAVSGHAWGVNGLRLADGWHHVAVTFPGGDSDDFSIYLDGVKQSASTLGGVRRQVDTRTGPAAIGRSVSGAAHYGGDIDDVRLYGYALSAEQVSAIAARNETSSAQEGAQAAAAIPGGLLPALPRASDGANGRGAGGFGKDGFGPSLTTASARRLHAPLLPSASDPLREGLVRIVNRSAQAGEVRIVAIDDAGWRRAPVVLAIGAGASAQFTSRDLEWGNATLGLFGAAGSGTGDWRLEISSDLDVEVLPYARAADGTLSAMGETIAAEDNVHRVALFHPADIPDAAGRLRLTNRGAHALRADIAGIDDAGASPGGMVSVEIAAHASVLLTAAEMEVGGSNLHGALGDGKGRWRLDIASDGDLAVMNLAETPDGRLANLSGAAATAVPGRRVHVVAGFPSSADPTGARGVLRIVNAAEGRGSIRIQPLGGDGWVHPPLTLALGGGGAANLDTWDLELGNAAKALSGSAGPGAGGAWRLAISSDGDIEVLAYARTPNGLLKPLPGDAQTKERAR